MLDNYTWLPLSGSGFCQIQDVALCILKASVPWDPEVRQGVPFSGARVFTGLLSPVRERVAGAFRAATGDMLSVVPSA